MTFESVIHAIQGTPGVESVKIFDLYQWERLPEDKKSIALEITIHGEGKTTTEEINRVMDNAISQAQKTGAILRVDFEQA
jgi:phenylalanyl-tRNA synthetase beta subunit